MGELLKTQGFILGCWIVLFIVFSGLGLGVRRLFKLKLEHLGSLLHAFWLGWALAIGILQIWHLAFKINAYALLLLSVLGLSGWLGQRRELWELVKPSRAFTLLQLCLLLLFGFWLANQAIGPIRTYDTLRYHITAVKWFSTYPLVPGLANLYSNLGNNQSFFLYGALLNVGPWFQKSHHLATGLLVLVLGWRIVLSMITLIRGRGKVPPEDLFYSLLLAPLLNFIFFSGYIPGLTPDAPVYVLNIVLGAESLQFLNEQPVSSRQTVYRLFYMVVLGIVGITIKLSYVVFGFLTITIVVGAWLAHTSYRIMLKRRVLLLLAGTMAAFLLPWCIRGVLLSGYLAYPQPTLSLPVSWRTPAAIAVQELDAIRGWARQPGAEWRQALKGWAWFVPWVKRMTENSDLIKPLELCVFGLLSALVQRRELKKTAGLLFCIPAAAAILFWFFSAPDPRFLGSLLWILGAGIIVWGLEGLKSQEMPSGKMLNLAVVFWVFLYIYPFHNPLMYKYPFDSPLLIRPYNATQALHPVAEAQYDTRMTDSQLAVNIAEQEMCTWDVPLPCTYDGKFYRGLRLRVPGDLRSGFVLDWP